MDMEFPSRVNVRVSLFDQEALCARWPGFESLGGRAQLARTRLAEPLSVAETHNTTTIPMHERIAGIMNRNESYDPIEYQINGFAVGSDDTEPGRFDRQLYDERWRTDLTAIDRTGATLFLTTTLDASEANGAWIEECGLYANAESSDRVLVNRTLIPNPFEKTSRLRANFDIELTVGNLTEVDEEESDG